MVKNWKVWLAVLIGLLVAGWLFAAVSWSQGLTALASALVLVSQGLAAIWGVYGLVVWREVPWVARLGGGLLATAAAYLLWVLAWAMGFPGLRLAITGAWLMGVTMVVGVLLIRLLLSWPHPVLSIARTLVDEAVRMKLVLVFVVGVLLIVPLLPFLMDPEEQLRYRIQSFLQYSFIVVSFLLSVMSVVLAIRTVTGELSAKQIYMTLSKPVARWQYLLGKWLGIVALNAVLVGVAGVGIYGFTSVLAAQEARGGADRMKVDQEVLVARQALRPHPANEAELRQQYARRLAIARQEDPGRFGQPGSPIENVPPAAQDHLQKLVLTKWYSLAPRGDTTYLFEGLDAVEIPEGVDVQAALEGMEVREVQLRLKPKAAQTTADGMVRLRFMINGIPGGMLWPRITDRNTGLTSLADNNFHVLAIPVQLIRDGKLQIRVVNPGGQPSVSFNTKDGLELFYRVDGFELNLTRSLLIVWVRLAFLAGTGLLAATFLTFPTACLACILIYLTAATSGFLAESLEYYASFPKDDLSAWDKLMWFPTQLWAHLSAGEVWDAMKILIKLVGLGFMALVPDFSAYNPGPLMADGRLVPYRMVGDSLLWVGLIWTGVLGLITWLIFRTKEIARVIV